MASEMQKIPDDLGRDVYSILGVAVDNIDMPGVLDRLARRIEERRGYNLVTPNLNFLVNSLSDNDFRDTILFSDLSVPDGAWLMWVGRLLGIPFRERVAGSDVLEALKGRWNASAPLKVFLFGGRAGAGEAACRAINRREDALRCVGALNPGFGSVDRMSDASTLEAINASGSDFLLVALGSKKGQAWLHQNESRIGAPVRAHLGATIDFYAGTIRRAPRFLQTIGMEWAWRIKEEPALWRRYGKDMLVLAGLLVTRVAPLMAFAAYFRLMEPVRGREMALSVDLAASGAKVIRCRGSLTARNVGAAAETFRAAIASASELVLDFHGVTAIDARFLGLLLMVEKRMRLGGRQLRIVGASRLVGLILHMHAHAATQAVADAIPLHEDRVST